MSSARDKLLGQFRELVVERLERVGKHLVKLDASADAEAGKATLRELHGLKGEARMMGFSDINLLVHEMEELLRAAAPRGYALTPQSTDALLVVSDAITVMSGASLGPPVENAKLLDWLKQRTHAEKGNADASKVAPAPASSGPVAFQPPSAPKEAPAPSFPTAATSGLNAAHAPSAPAHPPPLATPVPPPSVTPMLPADSPSRVVVPVQREPRAEPAGVRISQQSLETLTTSVASLLQRNRRRELSFHRHLQLTRELAQLHRMAEDMGPSAMALATRLQRAKEVVAELHRDHKILGNEEVRDLTQVAEEVQGMRMFPLSVLFEPYPRMVREVSRELGKEVDLTVDGEDTRVDRSVLEALKEPLMHLVRNALDHGLEPREARLKSHKPPRGRLFLSARREGERLLLRVEDDGRGLDLDALRVAAVRHGMMTPEDAARLTEQGAKELIFHAGFTSKEQATDMSGRGVGLDIVRMKLVALGGEVTVNSKQGFGTSFDVRVPVSFTLAPLLFIEVGQEQLCLTAANVDRAFKIDHSMRRELAGRPAVAVDDLLVPFGSISSILGAEPVRAPVEGELVLVVKGRGQAVAIAVDRVLEERVQAVLPLKGVLSRFEHLSGATALADGRLAMVLSAAHLVAYVQGQPLKLSTAPAAKVEQVKRKIMVVDDSPLTRELLSGLLEAVGFEIVNASDGLEGLQRLTQYPVDLVVTDLEMPRMDGLEFTRKIKADPKLKTLPVVIVTTRGSESDRMKGIEAGADGYVTKSDLVRRDLVDAVSRLLV